MPLARDQRTRIARALAWSRSVGWSHDIYPNTWRSADQQTHVRYDTAEQTLVVDHMKPDQDPLRCRVALVPIDSPDTALDVLAALGHLPWHLTNPWLLNDPTPAEACPTCQPLPCIAEIAADVPEPPDTFDAPADFTAAGRALADLTEWVIGPDLAAELLSKLADDGLIVSVAAHEEACGQLAEAESELLDGTDFDAFLGGGQ